MFNFNSAIPPLEINFPEMLSYVHKTIRYNNYDNDDNR